MIIKNVTINDLERALKIVNLKYNDNIIWNRFEQLGPKRFAVTLRVKDSRGPGHRIGHSGRRLIYACWHAHGDFFDALLSVNIETVIMTANRTISKYGGNWIDWNIGSIMRPLMYSEACDCFKETKEIIKQSLGPNVSIRARSISQTKLSAECWPVQVWGLTYCDNCEYKDKPECGGQNIRKTGINELGFRVPI